MLQYLSGNKILNKMGLSLMGATIGGGLYKAPVPSQAIKDSYHFRDLLRRFAGHVTEGGELTAQEEECLKKLGNDCSTYLNMKAHDSSFYRQVVSTLTDVIMKTGMPQVSGQNCENINRGENSTNLFWLRVYVILSCDKSLYSRSKLHYMVIVQLL